MKYQEISPSQDLSNIVRTFWTLETGPINPGSQSVRIFAEGYIGLLYQEIDYKHQASTNTISTVKSYLSVEGQRDTFITEDYIGIQNFSITGACLYPFAAKLLFNTDAQLLTNDSFELQELVGSDSFRLKSKLENSQNSSERLKVLSDYIRHRNKSGSIICSNPIPFCIRSIINSGGQVKLENLIAQSGISRRQFERRFAESAGMSPHTFIQVHRFHQSIRCNTGKEKMNLAELALNCGYFDQSHFNRVFKRFSGITPGTYFAHQIKADNFVHSIG